MDSTFGKEITFSCSKSWNAILPMDLATGRVSDFRLLHCSREGGGESRRGKEEQAPAQGGEDQEDHGEARRSTHIVEGPFADREYDGQVDLETNERRARGVGGMSTVPGDKLVSKGDKQAFVPTRASCSFGRRSCRST